MKRILLAYDGTEPAQRALDTTVDLATRFGATVAVISVIPLQVTAMVVPWNEPELHDMALREAQAKLRERGIEPELIEHFGDAATTIERVAAERHYDTIVLGSRGQGAIGRFLTGSVSGHVVSHADATVVVTH